MNALARYQSRWADEAVQLFRASARGFVERALVPQQERWRQQRRPDREAWFAAGGAGLLLPDVPEAYGGGGGSFAHQAVVLEELARAGACFGVAIQAVVAHYLLAYGSDLQKRRWLPRLAQGELVGAIAMSEPGAGSDLCAMKTTAVRTADRYVVNGVKSFITNGWHAGLVCLAVKTSAHATGAKGISLLLVETKDLAGYSVGAPLEKVGMHGQDTCELFFADAEIPAANLLGPLEGQGLVQMMEQLPYERLLVGVGAVAAMERAVALTTRYVKERIVFGKPLIELQNTRFKLAECASEARVGRVFIDHCIELYEAGCLDDAASAMAKYWLTDTQCRVVDECVQLHGGYGYMSEYEIARLWADSRVQRIYAGANEIMKELIAWSL